MSGREAAQILKVDPVTIYRWIKTGHATAENIGGVNILTGEEVQRLAANRPRRGRPRKAIAA